MNQLLEAMKKEDNFTFTENGGLTYKSTMSGLLDLFALGGAYRSRETEEKIKLFKKAYEEDATLAMKCLFYLRDVRGGQGERSFFREVMKWLARNKTETARKNLEFIPFFGRWDDLYTFIDTPLQEDALNIMREQFWLDIESMTPSLLGKWLKSENTSSQESRRLGTITRKHFGLTAKEYRKALSALRERIKVVEKLMSENRWDEIKFDKIPSKAGLIYSNAFARNDYTKERYFNFINSKETKVNTGTLYPCEVVNKVHKYGYYDSLEDAVVNKYWENLTDYFNNATFNGVAVVDTSGSMTSNYYSKINPIDVAISLGLYCAEKCGKDSPFYNHYISFSEKAKLIEIKGKTFADKVRNIYSANLCENTNIQSVFDLIVDTVKKYNVPKEEIPKNIIIISDMEFDAAQGLYSTNYSDLEYLMGQFVAATGVIPHLTFWNVNARHDIIPTSPSPHTTFVSGYSPVLFEQILKEKSSLELVLDKLNNERYKDIKA